MSAADDLRALIVSFVEAATGRPIPAGPFAPSIVPYPAQQGLAEALVAYFLLGGTSWKLYARVATNDVLPTCTYMDGALLGTGALPAIDGVTLVAGERVLVKDQVAPAQNGIYEVAATTPNWVLERADDAATGAQLIGAVILIVEGDSAAVAYRCTATGTVTIGTTPLAWEQWPATGVEPWDSFTTITGTTTDATSFPLDTVAPPVSCCVQVEANVVGFAPAGPLGGSWGAIRATFRVDGAGVVTQIGTSAPNDTSTEANWAATVDTDGTYIRVLVTGAAATTINWKSYMQIRSVS